MRFLAFLLLIGSCAPAAGESPWRLGIAVGYGERTNPLELSEDVPVVVDLDIAWFGERFFFDNGDLGYTLADTPGLTLSALARVNSDRLFFSRTNTKFVNVSLAGQALDQVVELAIPDRSYALEGGLELLAGGEWGNLQAAVHHDLGGTHDGFAVDVEYGYGLARGRWYVEPSLGLAFKSRRLNDYYWGVRAEEANEALPAYRAGSGTNLRAGLRVGYFLSRDWSLSAALRYERLNDDAAASPIVADEAVLGWFAGLGYRF